MPAWLIVSGHIDISQAVFTVGLWLLFYSVGLLAVHGGIWVVERIRRPRIRSRTAVYESGLVTVMGDSRGIDAQTGEAHRVALNEEELRRAGSVAIRGRALITEKEWRLITGDCEWCYRGKKFEIAHRFGQGEGHQRKGRLFVACDAEGLRGLLGVEGVPVPEDIRKKLQKERSQ